MPATSPKLHAESQQRTDAVALRHCVTPTTFMDQTIERTTLAVEQRSGFLSDALAAREEMRKTGKGYPAGDVHAYLQARVAGEEMGKPRLKSWRS